MRPASINEIKQELSSLQQKRLIELCLRLAKYKKENKELFTYLLFEEKDEQAFVEIVNKETDEKFSELPKATTYLTTKALRKIVRMITKYSRYMDSKESEMEMRIHFCNRLKDSGIRIQKDKAIFNLYSRQLLKLNELKKSLHEDLAFDFGRRIEPLLI